MTATAVRTPASEAAGPWSEPGAMLALAAMAAYVISTIKFMNRDPLSTTTGIQALIEIAAVAASVVLAAIPLVRSRFFPRPSAPAIGFAVFAATALLSSVFSYWPVLSLIKGGMLVAILFVAIALCATLSGADSFEDVGNHGEGSKTPVGIVRVERAPSTALRAGFQARVSPSHLTCWGAEVKTT